MQQHFLREKLIKIFLFQTNITYSNVVSVSHNLLSLVARATESAGDQNTNNLLNVSTVLNNTASLLTKIATVAGELFAEDLIVSYDWVLSVILSEL